MHGLAPALDLFCRMALALPGDNVRFKPDLSWMEQNTHILYPLFAIGTVLLLVIAIVAAWRSDEMSGVLKVEYKREVLTILRREPSGMSVARIAKELKLTVGKANMLIEEMTKDRQIVTKVKNGITTIRVRFE